MPAVDDQSGIGLLVLHCGADHTRLAVVQRRHGVEQMGDAGDPGRKGIAHRRVIGIGMSGRHDHPGLDQGTDIVGRGHFRCQRHHGAPRCQAAQQRDRRGIQPQEAGGVMRPLARRVQKGALDVDPHHARHARGDRLLGRPHGLVDPLDRVRDQRRQKGGGAEPRVRRPDTSDCLDARIVVEQHPAAAVDLRVDEAGQQPAALEVHGRARRARGRRDDPATLDVQAVGNPALAGHHPAVREGQAGGHRVSVTFLRCGGASGSIPRATASALTKR